MGVEYLFTVLFMILIFGNVQCSENSGNKEFQIVANNYAKWVQKTWRPDMFAFQERLSPPQVSKLKQGVSYFPEIQYNYSAEVPFLESLFSQCILDLYYTTVNLDSEWALKMLDSDGKLPSGLLGGNFRWLGDYKECLKIYAPKKVNSSMGNFHGRYCTVTWLLVLGNTSLPLSTGLCVPDSCSAEEIKADLHFLSNITGRFQMLRKFQSVVIPLDISCKPEKIDLDGPAIGMIFLLSVFGFLMMVGSCITVFEYFMTPKKRESPKRVEHLSIQNHSEDAASNNVNVNHVVVVNEVPTAEDSHHGNVDKQILLNSSPEEEIHVDKTASFIKSFFQSFCIFTNGAKILNTNVTEGQLLCIHGIRFLSMAWVILGHTYAFVGTTNNIANPLDTIAEIDTWEFQVVMQGTLSVDTFFVLSGFLLTYLFLREANKTEGKISWPFFYIHRYWRLTPVYMVILGFDTALTRYLSSGPSWSDTGFEPACKENWWRNLLYINNFGDPTQQCFGWAWYLANDMQFYIISPIFLYALWRWPRIGLSIVCTLLLSSWITSGVITTKYNLLSTYSIITKANDMQDILTRMSDFFWKMYVKPYTRIGPYLIGVLVGYLLYKSGNKKKFLEPWSQLLGWSFATALPLFVIFGVYDTELSTVAAGVFNALSRSAFAIGVGWVIYACLTGHGDVINKILSWKMFIPLSRLTYCAYLVHPIVIIGFYMSQQQPFYFSHLMMVTLFFGFLIFSYMIALIASLTLESPMMAIEKLLLRKS